MGHLLPTALAAWALALPLPRPPAPAPLAQLSKADAEWVTKKYDEAVKFGRAGKWGHDEAQAPVREILDLCARKLGPDHYLTAHYRREINTLEKLAGLPEADRVEYMKTYTLYDRIEELSAQRKYAEALTAAEEMLANYRRILGPGSFYEGSALITYGTLFRSAEKHDQAEAQYQRALKILLDVVGEDHTRTVDAYIYLALAVGNRDDSAEAGRLYQKAVDLSRRVLGDGHWKTAIARNNLAVYFERQVRYADAEELHRQALAALIAAGGEDGPGVAMARNNLAVVLEAQGKYAEAEKLYRRALDGDRKAARKDDEDVALFSGNLGVCLDAQGNHTAAEAWHRSALDLFVRALGAGHPKVAKAHSNLGVNLDYQGRYAEAVAEFDRALRVYRAIPNGESTPAAANVYSNLASCLGGQGKYEAGRAAAEKALAILRDRLPAHHPARSAAVNNLAANLRNQGKHAEAEGLFRDVLPALEKAFGPDHPDTALGRTNLGVTLHRQGRLAEAEPALRSALDALRTGRGEGHPRTAWAYKNVIENACARGDYAGVMALVEGATASFEAARLRLSHTGLARAGRTPDICPLPGLAVAAARRRQWDPAWQALERNLARGLLDDLAARPLSPAEREQEQALIGKLDLLDRRIELLRGRGADADADRRAAEADRNAAQTELARFQAGVTEAHGVAAGRVYPLARIQKQIPGGAALVAWVDLQQVPGYHDPRGDHWACLVKGTGDPVWVQLRGSGDDGAWTADDDRLAQRFRAAVSVRQPTEDWKGLAPRLAAQRLGPLTKALEGVHHLIVLPSAEMAGVPVETLTGLTVGYAPSGTMFAWLRERRAQAGAKAPAKHLLGFADPAYKKGDDGPVPLPGSRQELAGIGRVFDQVRDFKGSDASEQDLDGVAAEPGGLRRFGYLHFATHGVLDPERPMRSALLLAQDRLPDPLTQVRDGKEVYDGRLTAERILRHWKLDAELVTLSACQTGLGKYSGGEGYLGFSQALFVVGARSLVLSLWEVDDAATALLMARFYENLIGLRQGVPGGPLEPKPKAEALAEAKRWLRGLSPAEVADLTKDLPARGTRGRVVKKAATATAPPSFEHPYFWAGFILVGDPE